MSDASGLLLLVGRIVFAFFFLMAGYRHVVAGGDMTGFARSVGFPLPSLAPWPSGLVLVAGGMSIAAGVWPDIGALVLIVFLVPAMFWFHPFWKMPEDQKQAHSQMFFRNLTLIGACIALFAVFTGIGEGLRYAVTDALIDLR